jgi:hypothetical protein
MPAPRASDERGNGSDSRRPAMPGRPRRVRRPIGPRRTQALDRSRRAFRARYLGNGATGAFRVKGRPIGSRGRPIERRRRLRPRTSPKGRNRFRAPRKAKMSRNRAGNRRRTGSRRRPKTGIAKGRRGKRPESKHRCGVPGGPPPAKIRKFRPNNIGIIRTPAAAGNGATGLTDVTAESTANRVRASSKAAAIDSAHRRRPRVERARARYGHVRTGGKSAKFRPPNEALPIEPGSPNFARAFGPAVRREIRRRRDEISIRWGVREVENVGAPSPTRKPRVGSTSDRCQTKGPGQGSKLPKFEADRTNSFGDTGVRKITKS